MEEVETGVEEVPVESDPLDAADGGGSLVGTRSLDSEVPPDVRDKWGEASQLLFQPGYIHVLKQMALSGQLQMYNIRSVAWRLFLGCLPEDRCKWEVAVGKSRKHYNMLKKKHITDPHIASASMDVAVNNPLSQSENSPWHQFFLDNELRQMINQDVVRTFPDVAFFKQVHIQEAMLDLLFIYSKEKPDLCYRQGMHEILAPIIFILHAEERDHDDPCLAPEVQIVMDADYLEHDAYTIFAELMEGMEQWYMSSALEVDYYKTRSQANSNRKMQHDPRTQKPFESYELSGSSAISRKLEKIHHVLLRRADEVLFTHLKLLSIPAQTYGIRWIRLLFGREFPLPSVLELWDALFADGPSLGLIDYVCVAMLMHIREVLIEGDYAVCMQHLMRFPVVYEVNYLVQRALHLRNPAIFPSPRIWHYHPSRVTRGRAPPSHAVLHLMDETHATGTGKSRALNNTEKITDFFQSRARFLPKSSSSSRPTAARLEFHKSSSRSPSPNRKQPQETSPYHRKLSSQELDAGSSEQHLTDDQLFSGAGLAGGVVNPGKRTARFKILGDRNKSAKSSSSEREMTSNPKTNPLAEASLSELERLTTRLEDQEAKSLYCGGKMEGVIATLQDEIPDIPNLNPDTENTLFLAIAGLKQIRDLLLKKITFSGDSTLGWNLKSTRNQPSDTIAPKVHINTSALSAKIDLVAVPGTSGEDEERTPKPEHCEDGSPSGKEAGEGEEDDWVNLSSSLHPLVTSND